jgi:hypothetical protein
VVVEAYCLVNAVAAAVAAGDSANADVQVERVYGHATSGLVFPLPV